MFGFKKKEYLDWEQYQEKIKQKENIIFKQDCIKTFLKRGGG